MLNISAKEFVPSLPNGGGCGVAGGANTAACPRSLSASPSSSSASIADEALPAAVFHPTGSCPCPASNAAPATGPVADSNDAAAKAAHAHPHASAQLSPKAPAFVPRSSSSAVAAAASGSSGLDPRASLTQRSGSSVSSSVADPGRPSRTATGEGEAVGEDDHPAPAASTSSVGVEAGHDAEFRYEHWYDGAYCGEYAEGAYGCGGYDDAEGFGGTGGGDGGWDVVAAEGGVLSPVGATAYDMYGYPPGYDGYDMSSYNPAGSAADGLGGTVYYDSAAAAAYGAQYEAYQSQPYYWDPSTGAPYMYGDGYAGDEYGSWGTACDSAVDQQPTTAGQGDPDLDGLAEADASSLTPADAAELLGFFFPHYAGATLSRLLERTGGDLRSSFSELAAMERQLGAERAAAATATAGGGAGGRRGSRGGRAAGGGKGAGRVDFKLSDMTAFPSLSPAAPGPAAPIPAAPQPCPNSAPMPTPAANMDSSSSGHSRPSDGEVAKPSLAERLRNQEAAAATSNTSASTNSSTAAGQSEAAQAGVRGAVKPSGRSAGPDGAGKGGRAVGPGGAGSVPRVSTGEAVAAQYSEERQEASLLARARNQYFQQATLAYLSGNKALARQLGRKGREVNEAMKAAHAAAARRIFTQRNAAAVASAPAGPRQQQQQNNPRRGAAGANRNAAAAAAPAAEASGAIRSAAPQSLFVDLHGLHAAEAVAALETQIEEARAAGYRTLRVCTGMGRHTKGAKTPARLPAAVADCLLANHLTFRTLQPGLLEAQL